MRAEPPRRSQMLRQLGRRLHVFISTRLKRIGLTDVFYALGEG